MASFADDIVTFNPYVKELPVEDMIQVGMLKQEQYNQGVQRVQGMIDSIAGLEVSREVDKKYLNDRLSQLTGETGKVASADFSKAQLISSIGGLTGQIAADKNIRNAVASTAKAKAAVAKMDKAKAEGKSNPANEWLLQEQINAWQNSQELEAGFNGDWQEFYDVNKALADMINEIRKTPGASLRQNPYKLDPVTGQYVVNEALIEEEAKGVSPQKIRDAVATVLTDPRALKQVSINAQYDMRGLDKKALFERNKENYQNILDNNQKKIAELTIIANNGTEAQRAKAKQDLQEIQGETEQLIVSYNRDVDILDRNPDQFKVDLYTRNLAQSFANSNSYVTESTKIMTNPLFSAKMDMLNYNLNVAKHNLDVQAEDRMRRKDEADSAKEAAKKAGESWLGIPDPTAIGTQALEGLGAASFNEALNSAELAEERDMHSFINDTFSKTPAAKPFIITPNGTVRYRSKEGGYADSPYKTDAEAKIAAGKAFLETKDAVDRGQGDPVSRAYFKNHDDNFNFIRQQRAQANAIEQRFASNLEPIRAELKAKGLPENVTVKDNDGKDLRVNLTDLVDLAAGDEKSRQRIESRRGAGFYDKLVSTIFGTPTADSSGGEAAVSLTPTRGNELSNLFERVKKAGVSEQAVGTLNAREEEYRRLQTAFLDFNAPFVVNKPEERQRVNTHFRNIVSNISKAGGGLPEGVDIDDVVEMLNEDLKEGKGRLVYAYKRDQRTGQSFATLSTGVGEDEIQIPLTDQQAALIPGVRLNDEFYSRFGKRLMGGRTTDTDGDGLSSAITPPSGSSHGNYNVKVHLDNIDGEYAIRMYVADKQTGKLVANGEYFDLPGLDLLNQEQVMAVLSNIDEKSIERFLKTKGLQ